MSCAAVKSNEALKKSFSTQTEREREAAAVEVVAVALVFSLSVRRGEEKKTHNQNQILSAACLRLGAEQLNRCCRSASLVHQGLPKPSNQDATLEVR